MKPLSRRALMALSAGLITSKSRAASIFARIQVSRPIGVLIYGQSNNNGLSTIGQAPLPTPLSGTTFWNGSTFVAPPNNGVINFLNQIKTITGQNCWAVNGCVNAQSAFNLSKGSGTTDYANFLTQIQAAWNGTDQLLLSYMNGEDDNSGAPTSSPGPRAYWGYLVNQIRADLCSDIGIASTAQMPMVICGLATAVPSGTSWAPDAWAYQQETIKAAAANYPNIWLSHSNIDAVLNGGIHYFGNSYGQSGNRFGQSAGWRLGYGGGTATLTIAAAKIISATQTQITMTPGQGTDFTPSSGIVGFEINDNGTWVTATGVRVNSTTILLTHAAANTTSREIRYLYGSTANISSPVLDNSSLAVPLYPQCQPLACDAHPFPTFIMNASLPTTANNVTWTGTGLYLENVADQRVIMLVAVVGTAVVSSGTLGGVAITVHATAVKGGVSFAVISVKPGAGTPGVKAALSLTYNGGLGNAPVLNSWWVSDSTLSSTSPVDSETANAASASSVSVSVNNNDGGFLLTLATSNSLSTVLSMSGSATFRTAYGNVASGEALFATDVTDLLAGTLAVTSNSTISSNLAVLATAWR